MPHMAGKAFPFGGDRFVAHCRRFFLVCMTGIAEFPALLCEEGRILGSMGIMTTLTLPPLER